MFAFIALHKPLPLQEDVKNGSPPCHVLVDPVGESSGGGKWETEVEE